MKFLLLPLLVLTVLCPQKAIAANTISVFLYRADPNSKNAVEGFTEVYKWRMNESDEWRRFEYMASTMKAEKKENVSPFVKRPAELLVLSVKDANGITGKDYYLSPNGIMITAITSKNTYFEDTNEFFKFLKEEVSLRSSFEKFPGEKIPADAKGITVRYWINETLPNPAWLVNTQKDVNLYDVFMRKLPQIYTEQFNFQNSFNEKGTFTVVPNYPKAPAEFVTVSTSGIRLSKKYSEDRFIKDEKNYYKFFYKLTVENQNNNIELQKEDEKQKQRGNF